ncbi:hypothetical protein MUP77_16045, partial [Candidatus Bathyarchaeota archaeon]|nr:hypothetical protein [Candidatus Bathyarchaeota archaeon]
MSREPSRLFSILSHRLSRVDGLKKAETLHKRSLLSLTQLKFRGFGVGRKNVFLGVLVGAILLAASLLPVLPVAHAATMFADGFESGGYSAWTGTLVNSGHALTVDASHSSTGTYSSKLITRANGGATCSYRIINSANVIHL